MATSAGLATTSSASARGGQGWADGPSHNDLGDLVGRLPGNRKGRPKKEPESSLLFTKPAPQTARGGPRPCPTRRRRVYACPACLFDGAGPQVGLKSRQTGRISLQLFLLTQPLQ